MFRRLSAFRELATACSCAACCEKRRAKELDPVWVYACMNEPCYALAAGFASYSDTGKPALSQPKAPMYTPYRPAYNYSYGGRIIPDGRCTYVYDNPLVPCAWETAWTAWTEDDYNFLRVMRVEAHDVDFLHEYLTAQKKRPDTFIKAREVALHLLDLTRDYATSEQEFIKAAPFSEEMLSIMLAKPNMLPFSLPDPRHNCKTRINHLTNLIPESMRERWIEPWPVLRNYA